MADGLLGEFESAGSLVNARTHSCAQVVGNYVYVLGGSATAIERAPIQDASGNLGSFSNAGTSLGATGTARGTGCAVLSPWVYVFTGSGVRRAAILDQEGDLGSFSASTAVPGGADSTSVAVVGRKVYVNRSCTGNHLAAGTIDGAGNVTGWSDAGSLPGFSGTYALNFAALARIGGKLYVIGGSKYDCNTDWQPQTAIYSAPITDSQAGTIGSFSLESAALGTSNGAGEANGSGPVVVAGRRLFVLGAQGTGSTYDYANLADLNSSGDLGAFSDYDTQSPSAACKYPVAGNYVYRVGGWTGSAFTDAVDRAAVDAAGSLGSFGASGYTLGTAREGAGAFVGGGRIFIAGGWDGSSLASVESAPFGADGAISDSFVAENALPAARNAIAPVVAGSHVYVVGGAASSSAYADTVFRATLSASGGLGTWSTESQTLVTARSSYGAAVVGKYLYVFGGYNGGLLDSVERAALNSDGTLNTSFSTVSGVTLPTAMAAFGTAVVGKVMYLVGQNKLFRADIQDNDGNISTFTEVSGVTPRANTGNSLLVLGNYLYSLGGYAASGFNTTSQRALLQ